MTRDRVITWLGAALLIAMAIAGLNDFATVGWMVIPAVIAGIYLLLRMAITSGINASRRL